MQKASEVVRKQLAQIRKRQGLTQTQLVERMKENGYDQITRTVISKIEQGTRSVSLDDALALAAVLGISPVHLFVPYEKPAIMEITNTITATAVEVRGWVRGWNPLPVQTGRRSRP